MLAIRGLGNRIAAGRVRSWAGSTSTRAARREASRKPLADHGGTLLPSAEAVRENEEVVPVNVSTWVLSSGVTVGR